MKGLNGGNIMADCDCDFCPRELTCKYAYDNTDCLVNNIKAAKVITASDYFTNFYNYVRAMEDLLVSDALENLVYTIDIFKEYAEMEE